MKPSPIFFLLVLAGAIAFAAWAAPPAETFEVSVFDVGQGDAIFLKTPQGHQVLIDGGPDAIILEKLGRTMPFWDRTIDVVVLTHPDADHLAGLLDVLERYEVSMIIESGLRKETLLSQAWEEAVVKEGAEVVVVNRPLRVTFGAGTVLDFLWPLEDLSGQVRKDPNEYSIVARLSVGKTSFLFPGDIERWGEQKLLVNRMNVAADVLKIPHHGSKTSTSEVFLAAVAPATSVISVGNNRYGHPTELVLERLQERSIQILRTDEKGDIVFRSDGEQIFYD